MTTQGESTESESTAAREIEHYLATGESDPLGSVWPGGQVLERVQNAHRARRGALVTEVRRRTEGRTPPPLPEFDLATFAHRKLEPMVCGLLPKSEQAVVLEVIARSIVFVTPNSIESTLFKASFDSTAWTIANLYLGSVRAEFLSPDAPSAVGLCVNNTCYVSTHYFHDDDRFADFVVHEAAHLLHDLKRAHHGLRATRSKERIVDIDYSKRETFAYSCEAFSRVLELATNRAHRLQLAAEFARDAHIPDDRVEDDEVAELIREAASSRNGWKVIRERCAP